MLTMSKSIPEAHPQTPSGSRLYGIPLLVITLACLGTCLWFTLGEWQAEAGQLGVPLDDAWIHFRFAENLATGHGFSYNQDVPAPGSTSPLWVLLLTLLYPFTHEFLITAKVLGVLFEILTCYLLYLLALRMISNRLLACAAALLTALVGRMTWGTLSGMEVTLFAFLSLGGIYLYAQSEGNPRRRIVVSLILGLATQARPEGYLLFGLFLMDQVIEGVFRSREGRKASARLIGNLSLEILLYLLVSLPYVLFSLETTGRPLPATYYAKRGLGIVTMTQSWEYLKEVITLLFAKDNTLLTWLLPFGLIRFFRKEGIGRGRLLGIWFLGFFLVSAKVTPNLSNMGRYILPLAPIFALLGVLGGIEIASWLRKIKLDFTLPKFGISFWTALSLILALWQGGVSQSFWKPLYIANVDNINKMQVEMGKWARENLPPSSLIALNDVGAIIYFSHLKCLDTVGLVSPELLPYLRRYALLPGGYRRGIWQFLKERRPDYLVIFPEWYPEFPASPALEPVHQIEYPNSTGGGNVLVVYRTHWEKEE
jgi:arabinofuranosyltransferase